jgi:predicted nucleic acid-binding protein
VVRFWDSSALVPLFFVEPASARVKAWLKEDAEVVVWALARVELLSALARRRRELPLMMNELRAARRQLLAVYERWLEIAELDAVRQHAERIVETHPLRAADALQIGAALVAAAGDPYSLEFVTFDRRLAQAADREGFPVLGG